MIVNFLPVRDVGLLSECFSVHMFLNNVLFIINIDIVCSCSLQIVILL